MSPSKKNTSQKRLKNTLSEAIKLFSERQFLESQNLLNSALRDNPMSAKLYNVKGACLAELGKVNEAIDCYRRSAELDPNYAQAHNNLGVLFEKIGNYDEALQSFDAAIKNFPEFPEALNNKALSLRRSKQYEQAVTLFIQAIKLSPEYAEAFNNLAVTLQGLGNHGEALKNFQRALEIRPEYEEVYRNLGVSLQGMLFEQPASGYDQIITKMLDFGVCVRPLDIAPAAISLLKFDPVIQGLCSYEGTKKWDKTTLDMINQLSEIPLLLRLMSVTLITDINLEFGLRNLRANILKNLYELPSSKNTSAFQAALALQCFNNEYIYSVSAEESYHLNEIENSIEKALIAGKGVDPRLLLCLASFRPLYEYKWAVTVVPDGHTDEVLTRQVFEPRQEKILGNRIPTLGGNDDSTSKMVRQQYEENPYPRWSGLGLPACPKSISEVIADVKLSVANEKILEIEEPLILIAGCGTGQHAIDEASRFSNSKVYALDLSLTSLSYAARKSAELDIENITFLQGNILNLRKLNKKFHIIESSGVLHHMADPREGWRVLSEYLKEGGLMKIGLYSKHARQHIEKIRTEIQESKMEINPNNIRIFRNRLVRSDETHHRKILASNDLFCMSSLRDLLFHVQEHTYTIPMIADDLAKLGMVFCGFEGDQAVQSFEKENMATQDLYDLNCWDVFERSNPDIFSGMYQFWCQKIS